MTTLKIGDSFIEADAISVEFDTRSTRKYAGKILIQFCNASDEEIKDLYSLIYPDAGPIELIDS